MASKKLETVAIWLQKFCCHPGGLLGNPMIESQMVFKGAYHSQPGYPCRVEQALGTFDRVLFYLIPFRVVQGALLVGYLYWEEKLADIMAASFDSPPDFIRSTTSEERPGFVSSVLLPAR